MKEKFKDVRFRINKGWLLTIGITLLLVLSIFLIFDSVMVVGESMLPNFIGGTEEHPEKGDKVIISRIYGLNYGDVVVFYNKSFDENMIKRVIGLEGDEIQIKETSQYQNGTLVKVTSLYRNGKLIKENYINEDMHIDNRKWTVKKDQVFVMGDNRNHSVDSRSFGAINKSDILGEVIIKVDTRNGKIYFI